VERPVYQATGRGASSTGFSIFGEKQTGQMRRDFWKRTLSTPVAGSFVFGPSEKLGSSKFERQFRHRQRALMTPGP